MKTRAPWALTFSVNILPLSFGSASTQTSTLTVLAIRLSDRPFDILLRVLQSLRVLGSMLTARSRSIPLGAFVRVRGVICFVTDPQSQTYVAPPSVQRIQSARCSTPSLSHIST